MRKMIMAFAVVLLVAASAQAVVVNVEASGMVIFNQISGAPLENVNSGEQCVMSFTVNSDNFDEGTPGDTRGYIIDEDSFMLEFSGGVSIGLENPFPPGETPYFTLVDGFPVSDGFFVSTSPFSPGGVPLAQDTINFNLDLGYDGDTLESLDILDALGVYGFGGLTRFGMNFWRIFPDNVGMELDFEMLTIDAPVSSEEASWGAVKSMFR
jgi:hypothetical protein